MKKENLINYTLYSKELNRLKKEYKNFKENKYEIDLNSSFFKIKNKKLNYSDPTLNQVIKINDMDQQELNRIYGRIEKIHSKRKEVFEFLNNISLVEKEILSMKYIDKMTWKEISYELSMSECHIQRIANKLLE